MGGIGEREGNGKAKGGHHGGGSHTILVRIFVDSQQIRVKTTNETTMQPLLARIASNNSGKIVTV